MNPEHSGEDASLAPIPIVRQGTALTQRGMGQIIGRFRALTGQLRDALRGRGSASANASRPSSGRRAFCHY